MGFVRRCAATMCGWAGGFAVLFWTVSRLVMVAKPIDECAGQPARTAEADPFRRYAGRPANRGVAVIAITLRWNHFSPPAR